MKTQTGMTYESILAAQQRVPAWKVEDLIGGERRLDFSKRFLPEGLAGVDGLAFLSESGRRTLNQIRGHEYLAMFGLVEEFILPFVMDHVRPRLHGRDAQTRALLQFAGEEAKHIDLFRRFRAAFGEGFGSPCEVIGPPEAVAKKVLGHHPLAVALLTLHIEWFVQRHFLESVKDNHDLDPLFRSLLKYHWVDEVQHGKLDLLMIRGLAEDMSLEERFRAFDEYLELGGFLDQALGTQMDLNLQAFTRATGWALDGAQKAAYEKAQRRALRWTYIGSGITHPVFLEAVEELDPALRRKAEELGPLFC